MVTGIKTIGQTTYLFTNAGYKSYGWHRIDGKDYYFDPLQGGGMLKGKHTIGQTTYLFHNDGYKVFGWHRLSDGDHYFDPNFGGGLTIKKAM